jgi:hypothetical protein
MSVISDSLRDINVISCLSSFLVNSDVKEGVEVDSIALPKSGMKIE